MARKFPYTNFHDLNLDWIIKRIQNVYNDENPPPYPVRTVNGQEGNVNLTGDDIPISANDITPISTAVDSKIDKPQTTGANGQVLTADGLGGVRWSTPADPEDIIDDSAGALTYNKTWSAHKLFQLVADILDLEIDKMDKPASAGSDGQILSLANGLPVWINQTDVDQVKNDLGFDANLINDGYYIIKKEDLESGQWSYSRKDANPARARTKNLFPVKAGMSISYINSTFDTYFGVLETPTSMSYIQTIGWKTNSAGTINITKDGYLTFIIRNHHDNTAPVDPEDFNNVVTIKTNEYSLSLKSGSTTLITTLAQAVEIFNADANNAEVNTIIGIGQSSLAIINLPLGSNYLAGNLYTLSFRKGLANGITQIYQTYTGRIFIRAYSANVWRAWTEIATSNDLTDITKLVTNTMVTSNAIANTMFGQDLNNLDPNKVYCIGSTGLTIANTPYPGFVGDILSLSFRETSAQAGRMQIALSNGSRLYARAHFGGSWRAWQEYSREETVYRVGPTRTYTSLVGLLKTIQTDNSPKVIYIDEGVYDIYQEYRDNNIPSPPAGVQSADYFDYNVFLPQNTKLIGIGNVVLQWNPSSNDITVDESKTWSPLNLWYGGNTVENITILCKNGRYGIHDDSHNAYTDFTNIYRNVRVIYTESDSGYGFNNTLGFGFEDRCTYIFENCYFEFVGSGNKGVFYGHDGQTGGASIIVNNSIFLGGTDSNNMTIRLQSIRADDSNRILTNFNGCHIQGGIRLTQYTQSAGQFFDVTFLHSGNPAQTIDISVNPYPIKVYQ